MSERQQAIGHEAHVLISLVKTFAASNEPEIADDEAFRLWSATYGTRRLVDESARYSAGALVAWQLVRRLAEAEQRSAVEILDELDQRIFDSANHPDEDE